MPQAAQNQRVTGALVENVAGVPQVNVKLSEATDSQATAGAANSLRQVVQWQTMLPTGEAVSR